MLLEACNVERPAHGSKEMFSKTGTVLALDSKGVREVICGEGVVAEGMGEIVFVMWVRAVDGAGAWLVLNTLLSKERDRGDAGDTKGGGKEPGSVGGAVRGINCRNKHTSTYQQKTCRRTRGGYATGGVVSK